MNIRQIINEEVNAVLQEQEGREVIGALEQIAQKVLQKVLVREWGRPQALPQQNLLDT